MVHRRFLISLTETSQQPLSVEHILSGLAVRG